MADSCPIAAAVSYRIDKPAFGGAGAIKRGIKRDG